MFKLGDLIRTNLSKLSINFKYEKNINKNSENEQQVNIADLSLPPSNISNKSIQIIQNVYKTGYDICNFNKELKLKDFCFNNCDITQMSVSLNEKGNIKINILDKILNKVEKTKKDKEFDSIIDWDKYYEDSLNKDYNLFFNYQLKLNNFDDIISILYQNLIIKKDLKRKNNISTFFPEKLIFPPKYYNNIPSISYLDEISLYNPINININKEHPSILYSDILESHPQLPVYLSSNTEGLIFLYSFSEKNKISNVIDEFYIDKIESNENHFINRIKFNSYGDNFMACDTEGNLYNWSFDHIQSRKIPQNIINNSSENKNNFFCNDMCYLNNTGVIATISNKNIIIYDLLMPEKKRKINEIISGGELLIPLPSNYSFIISNNNTPGKISFIDIRKMEIFKTVEIYNVNNNINQKINNIKIMDMKLSENENYLITYGSDYSVKIWDLSEKCDPLLIESFHPFNNKNKENNEHDIFRGKLKLSSGYLFVSKDNNIKLLRNNII